MHCFGLVRQRMYGVHRGAFVVNGRRSGMTEDSWRVVNQESIQQQPAKADCCTRVACHVDSAFTHTCDF